MRQVSMCASFRHVSSSTIERIYLSLYLSIVLQPFVWSWPLFQFLILLQSVGLLGRGSSPSQGRYLHTGQHKHGINKHRRPLPHVWFEHTIPVLEWAKTVHAVDRAAIVIGYWTHTDMNLFCQWSLGVNFVIRIIMSYFQNHNICNYNYV
jgi:hypothetical protein